MKRTGNEGGCHEKRNAIGTGGAGHGYHLLLIWAFMQALLMIWAPADTQTTYLLLLFLMDIAVLCGFMDRVNTGTALAATITCGWVAYKLYSFYAVGETVYLTDYL